MSDGLSDEERGVAAYDYPRALEAVRSGVKDLRHVERCFCPHCGKLVAGIVVIGAARWFYRVGGRNASHGQYVDALEREAAGIRAQAQAAGRDGAQWLADRWGGFADEVDADLERVRSTGERRVAGGQVVAMKHLVATDLETAPCRGCRRDVPLNIDPRKYVSR